MANLKVLNSRADQSIVAEPGIEMPVITAANAAKYPWKTMAVGDSFPVPADCSQKNFTCYVSATGKRLGLKFTVRKMPDGTQRCWRVA